MPGQPFPLESAIAELLAAKSASGRSAWYAESLSILLRQFARGRERLPIATMGVRDVEGFLDARAFRCGSCSMVTDNDTARTRESLTQPGTTMLSAQLTWNQLTLESEIRRRWSKDA